MKCLFEITVVIAILFCCISVAAQEEEAPPIVWQKDIEAALKESYLTGRPLFLHFCPEGRIALNEDMSTFQENSVKSDAVHFVWVRLDPEKYRDLGDKYGVKEIPALVVVDHNKKKLNKKNFEPRGMTALYDAIGTMINQTKTRLKQEQYKPKKVLVVILTDGLENASREFSHTQIAKKIRTLENKHHWHFIFLAANQDAVLEGAKFGIQASKALTFEANNDGVSEVLFQMSSAIKESSNSEEFNLTRQREN